MYVWVNSYNARTRALQRDRAQSSSSELVAPTRRHRDSKMAAMRTKPIAALKGAGVSDGLDYERVKRLASELARRGDWMNANVHYSLCVAATEHATRDEALGIVLMNRALTSLKLGDFAEAKRDGYGAIEMLRARSEASKERERLVGKAMFRIGCACVGLGEWDEAIVSLLNALETAPKDVEVQKKLMECARGVKMTSLCDAYARAISEGEMPNALSPRDGKWLKPVRPESSRLSKNAMAQTLADCVIGNETEWRREFGEIFLVASGSQLSAVRRGFLSGVRAIIYAHTGNHTQAVKDYKVALSYYPEWDRAYYGYALSIEHQLVHDNMTRVEVGRTSCNGMHDALIVDAQVASALWMKRAMEIQGTNAEYQREYARLSAKLSEELRDVLSTPSTGFKDAVEWLEEDKWENAPEYVRPRPKYYYFYEMMKERIYEHYPELPQPVMDKLLSLDAGELDLLLQYPRAIKGQTEEFLDVYQREGGEYLATYKSPTLTWDEVKALKGKGTQGLLADGGRNAIAAPDEEIKDPGSGFSEEKDTDHALVGASGEDGLTRAELEGAPIKPTLPPDQLRDETNRLAASDEYASGTVSALLEAKSSSRTNRIERILAPSRSTNGTA